MRRWLRGGIGLAALLVGGCNAGDIPTSPITLTEMTVMLTPTDASARAACAQYGLNLIQAEWGDFMKGGSPGERKQVFGCYVPAFRLVICPYDSGACLVHEFAHASGRGEHQ